jgi:hypothetical protein
MASLLVATTGIDGRCEKTKRTALQIRQKALNSSV